MITQKLHINFNSFLYLNFKRSFFFRKFPWGIILLMGGGFALADGARWFNLSHATSLRTFLF